MMKPISIAAVYLSLCRAANLCAAESPHVGRPNILWITSEDNGPHLGAYGDEFADTPNLDRLAARNEGTEVDQGRATAAATTRECLLSRHRIRILLSRC